MNLAALPQSQIEAIRFFGNADNCHNFLVGMRWPNGVRCAHCESENVGKLVVTKTKSGFRRVWNCKNCKSQFTAKVGTIFQDSPLPLEKWLPAVWMICNAKNGVSSCEIARSLDVTQKTAWFMLHRIRVAMRDGGFQLKGEVEADETFVGGKAINKRASKRSKNIAGPVDMVPVLGMLQRSEETGASKIVAEVVPSRKKQDLQKHVRATVEKGSSVYTDALLSYHGLSDAYMHGVVDHAVEYVNGRVHTNGLENFWSLLKRTLKGTYVQVSPDHLFRYLDEQVTRFNERKDNDGGRFVRTMQRVHGRYLPYKALTGIGMI